VTLRQGSPTILNGEFEHVDDNPQALSPKAHGFLKTTTSGFRERVAAALGLKSARGANGQRILDYLTKGNNESVGRASPGILTHGLLLGYDYRKDKEGNGKLTKIPILPERGECQGERSGNVVHLRSGQSGFE